jgi:hypothetical protein
MNRRKLRQQQFSTDKVGGWAWITTSQSLATCAVAQLALSLEDRHRGYSRWPNNHYSDHALGAILLIVAAFEAWLNESVRQLWLTGPRMALAEKGIVERYETRAYESSGSTFSALSDLSVLVDVRHEIEHFLPRAVDAPNGLPPWLAQLIERGYLIDSRIPGATPLGERFKSYGLAYWAFETVRSAAFALEQPLGEQWQRVGWTALNFELYLGLFSPTRLDEHDKSCPGVLNQALLLTENGARKPGLSS